MKVQLINNDRILFGFLCGASELDAKVRQRVEEYKHERTLLNCSDITTNKVSAIGSYDDLISFCVKTFSPDSAVLWGEASQGQCAIDLNKIIPMPDLLVFDHEYLAGSLEYWLHDDSAFFSAMGPEWKEEAQAIGNGNENQLAAYVRENPDSDFTVAAVQFLCDAVQLLNGADSEIKTEALKYWKMENWGSSSNSHHRECGPIVPLCDGSGQYSLTFMFDTVWTYPGRAFDQLVSDWTSLDFRIVILSEDSDGGLCFISRKGVKSEPTRLDEMEIRVHEFGYVSPPDSPRRLIPNYREGGKLSSPYTVDACQANVPVASSRVSRSP